MLRPPGPSYLRTLPAVRERCSKVYKLAQEGQLEYFELHEDKLAEVVDFCGKIITVSCSTFCCLWSLEMAHRFHPTTVPPSALTLTNLAFYPLQRDYGTNYSAIPPHSRWRHFATPSDNNLLGPLLASWSEASLPPLEIAKRLIDLFVVSVLLDGTCR